MSRAARRSLCLAWLLVSLGCADKVSEPQIAPGWRSAGLILPDADKVGNGGGGLHRMTHVGPFLFAMDAYMPANAPASRQSQWRIWQGKAGSSQWLQLKMPEGEIPNAWYASDNKLYIGTKYSGRVLVYTPSTTQWDSLKFGLDSLYQDSLPRIESMAKFKGKLFVSIAQDYSAKHFCWLGSFDGIESQRVPCATEKKNLPLASMIEFGDALYGIRSQFGIYRYHEGDSAWETLPSARGRTLPEQDEGVSAIGVANGKLYVGYEGYWEGLFRWDEGTWTSMTPTPGDGTNKRETPQTIRVITSYQGRLMMAGGGGSEICMRVPQDSSKIAFGDWRIVGNFCHIADGCTMETWGIVGIGDTLYASSWNFIAKIPMNQLDAVSYPLYK